MPITFTCYLSSLECTLNICCDINDDPLNIELSQYRKCQQNNRSIINQSNL